MNRLLAPALSALIVLFAGSAVNATTNWQSKVDQSVLRAAAYGATDFMVYMNAHADLTAADGISAKAAKGAFVYDQLTTVARESQAPVVSLLRSVGSPAEQYWITNAIVSRGDLDVIEALALRADVRAVYAIGRGEQERPIHEPAAVETTTAGPGVTNSVTHVGAEQVWALGYRGQGAVVAGADSGVRWTHNALKAHYRGWHAATGTADHNYNWHDAIKWQNTACPGNSPQPCDDDVVLGGGHGSHTMGTMVGDDGNGNQTGMAPGAKFIACRNMNNGVGAVPLYLDCMQWFIAPTDLAGGNPDPSKAPDVINNSWGCVEVCAPPVLKDAIDASRAAGIFYVVSAGNDNQWFLGLHMQCNTIAFPLAIFKSALTVGATDATNDGIADYSSIGPVSDNPIEGVSYRKPDITAPGSDIRSSLAGSDDQYGLLSGTSMAGPHVAGLVALIISANPALRGHVDAIEDIIESTAVPLTSDLGCGSDTTTSVPNNVFGWGRIDALAAVQKALVTQPEENSSQELVGLPASVVAVAKETTTQTHPTTDHSTGAAVDGTTNWRVVKDTGNCCENHLGLAKDGQRLFDIGGSYVNYSDDRGSTWISVRPPEPLVNGEGSIAVAPNGDILGITWDAYSGDHLVAYKYNAETGQWLTLTNVLHQFFYDRPWLSVIPGPFTDATGKVVPYVSIVEGGTGVKDPMFVSTDGLIYAEPSINILGDLSSGAVTRWIPTTADPANDWDQPIRSAPVTPLGAGYAMDSGGYLLDPQTREWHPWTLPNGADLPTYFQVDSAGRVHEVRSAGSGSLEYRISPDGGQNWTSAIYDLPMDASVGRLIDFKVNRAVGIGAVAVRIDAQDWLYKFDISTDTARLLRVYRVGLGDNPAGSDVGALTSPRMDFQNVVIFADGRVATSFLDSTTLSHPPGTGMLGRIGPALAIELDSSFDVSATPSPTATATSSPTPTPTPTATPTPTSTSGQCQTTTWSEDLEPSADGNWRSGTDQNNLGLLNPTWSQQIDTGAHSASHSWSNDARTLDLKDSYLIAPTQKIGLTTRLSFWHRYFMEEGYDGGVLEVSTDSGLHWRDVTAAGTFVTGGYNDMISTEYGSPIAGRRAWTGGEPTARVDAMTRVEVALGGFVPAGKSSVNALVRWRYAADELGGLPGDEWWLDDISFSDVVVSCPSGAPTQSPSPSATATPTPTPVPTPTPTADSSADHVYLLGVVNDGNEPGQPREDFQADMAHFESFLGTLRQTYSIPDSQATILAFTNGWHDAAGNPLSPYAEASEANVKAELARLGALASQHSDSIFFFFLSTHGIVYANAIGECPVTRVAGSLSGLKAGDGESGDFYDCELGDALNANFALTTRMFVMVDCSVCGGFSDSLTAVSGTVPDNSVPESAGVVGPNRIVATGCAMTTECFGSDEAANGGVSYHHMQEVLDGGIAACDGWTVPGFPLVEGFDFPVRDELLNPRDGRCTASELFFGAVYDAYVSQDAYGIQQQFRIKYGFDSLADDLLIL